MVVSFLAVNRCGAGFGDGWFLAVPVGRAFDDEFVGGGGEAVDCGLGQERVGHHGEPFLGGAVGGHDGRGFPVPFDAELVEVGGFGGVERGEREVVEDEQVDAGDAAHLDVEGVVEAGGPEPLEQLGGGGHQDGAAPPDGDVPEGAGQVGLADPDGPEYQGSVGAVEEPQAGQLVPELPVVGDGGGVVPGVEPHAVVEPGGAGAQRGGFGFAAGVLVGEDELEEVGVGHFLLPGQDEAVREGVQHLAELERAQRGAQVRAYRVGDGVHRAASSLVIRASWVPVRYSAGSRANRAAAAAAAGSGAGVFSVAFSSMEAILVTLMTSNSSARAQAVSTGPSP